MQNKSLQKVELEPTQLQKAKFKNQIEKQNLIDRFFNIGSNRHIDKLLELEMDLGKFNAENNDEDIRKLLIVLEMFRINARSKEIYTLSNEFNELFVEMYEKNNMSFFEIRISLLLFAASDEPEEIFALVDHLVENVDNYMTEPNYIRVRFSIYQNAADTLMFIRRNYDTYQKDEYDSRLMQYLINAVVLANQYDSKYWRANVRMKLGIIVQDDVMIRASIEELKSLNDELIDKHITSILKEYSIEY